MRFRGKSIRRKIVALLLVPLVSLTAVWGFATVLTGREASRLFTMSSLVEKVGYPIEDTVRVVQQERRQALVYLADPRASDALSALRRTRTATDEALAEIRTLLPSARTALVASRYGLDAIDRAHAVGAGMLVLNIRRLTLELVERAHAADLKVIGWTVNTPDHLKLARGLGLDGGTTDFPEIRRAVRYTA